MAVIALNSAATGLSALNTELDVIANNLANLATAGFKRSRANFQDLLYQERAQPGVENLNGDERPTGLYVGLGTKISGTQVDFAQGPVAETGRELDVAILGNGFYVVEIEDDVGEGLGYTRAGNFTLNSDGEIVLATDQGRRLLPNLVVPEDATDITIQGDGSVWVALPGETDPTLVGNFELATFINPSGLKQIGENLFLPSAASGEAQIAEPTEEGRGRLQQGFLEQSNVDPVLELVNLIKTQRAFELNSQVIQAADEVMQTVTRLRSF